MTPVGTGCKLGVVRNDDDRPHAAAWLGDPPLNRIFEIAASDDMNIRLIDSRVSVDEAAEACLKRALGALDPSGGLPTAFLSPIG